jgi:hypothetical protein
MNFSEFAALLTHSDGGNSLEDISVFEQVINSELPPDYREFLSIVDGGFLPSDEYPNALVFNKSPVVPVANVFGLRERKPLLTLFWYLENLGVPLPDDLIAIMDDGSGNLICLGISAERYGKLFFRYGGDIEFVCSSFRGFIEGLIPWAEHPDTHE